MPHIPQFISSDSRSTQASPQLVRPVSQHSPSLFLPPLFTEPVLHFLNDVL